MNADNIEIAFCFSKTLLEQVAVAITSLLVNRNGSHYQINIFYYGNDDIPAGYFSGIISRYDCKSRISCLRVRNIFKGAGEMGHVNEGTYLRLMLPQWINSPKVIYCDVDTIVSRDLSVLWNYDMGGEYICGVKDQINLNSNWNLLKEENGKYWNKLQKGAYINAGVLLMNLHKLRMDAEIMDMWQRMPFENYKYQDQDIINISCRGKIGFLPLQYNLPGTNYFRKNLRQAAKEGLYTKTEILGAIAAPTIVHYLGAYKPWNSRQRLNPYYRLWRKMEKKRNQIEGS